MWSGLRHYRVLAGCEDRDAMLLGHGGDGVEDFAAVFGAERVGELVEDQDPPAGTGGGEQGGEDEVDGEQFPGPCLVTLS